MRKMKDSGIEWLGMIPEDWETERLQWHISEIKESNKPEKSRRILSLTNKRGVIPYEEKGAQGNTEDKIRRFPAIYDPPPFCPAFSQPVAPGHTLTRQLPSDNSPARSGSLECSGLPENSKNLPM